MNVFKLGIPKEQPVHILCLGAHSDDLEIGCGGTILQLQNAFRDARIDWIVFGGTGVRKKEAKLSAELFLKQATRKRIVIKTFRDGFFPYNGGAIKQYFEELKQTVKPDIIFTHYHHDLHQDHRLIAELTWNTFRDHLIMEYEIVKYDGDIGSPNVFVPLDRSVVRKKLEIINAAFASQRSKQWFSDDVFKAIMRLRGVESNSPSKYAEAFYSRKVTLSVS